MNNKNINIFVTGSGSLFGQGILKSLKKSSLIDQIQIIGADYFPNTPGSFWCNEHYILPDILKPEISETDWLQEVESIISKHDIKVIFPGAEFELILFAKNKEYLQDKFGCTAVVCDEQNITIGNDKFLTYEFLKENGFNYPLTCLPENFDTSGIQFPCIVKPRRGARSIGVSLVNNKEELKIGLDNAEDPIIQECVGNRDTEYTCGVLFMNGKVEASIVLQRTLKDGNTKTATHKKDFPPQIDEYIRAVGNALKADGATNFQLRLDDKGTPKIFEINPRHSGTTYMRCLFGYNEVEMILRNILSLEAITPELKEGSVVRYFEEILY